MLHMDTLVSYTLMVSEVNSRLHCFGRKPEHLWRSERGSTPVISPDACWSIHLPWPDMIATDIFSIYRSSLVDHLPICLASHPLYHAPEVPILVHLLH